MLFYTIYLEIIIYQYIWYFIIYIYIYIIEYNIIYIYIHTQCSKPCSIGNWRDIPRICFLNVHVMLSHFVFPFKKFMVALIEGSIFFGLVLVMFSRFWLSGQGKIEPHRTQLWPLWGQCLAKKTCSLILWCFGVNFGFH